MSIKFPIFNILLWGVGGVLLAIILTILTLFLIPIQIGVIIVFIVALVLGFIKTKSASSLLQGSFVGLLMALLLIEIFFWGDVGGYFLRIFIGGFFIEKFPESNNMLFFSFYLVLLTTLSGFIGGLLAKLYQKFSNKH